MQSNIHSLHNLAKSSSKLCLSMHVSLLQNTISPGSASTNNKTHFQLPDDWQFQAVYQVILLQLYKFIYNHVYFIISGSLLFIKRNQSMYEHLLLVMKMTPNLLLNVKNTNLFIWSAVTMWYMRLRNNFMWTRYFIEAGHLWCNLHIPIGTHKCWKLSRNVTYKMSKTYLNNS